MMIDVRFRVVLAVLRRPSLWMEAIRTGRALGRQEWWHQLLLVPESEHLRWRVMTAYGDPEADLQSDDVVRYLRWRRRQRVT
jgi:hypothetical protein